MMGKFRRPLTNKFVIAIEERRKGNGRTAIFLYDIEFDSEELRDRLYKRELCRATLKLGDIKCVNKDVKMWGHLLKG